MIGKEQFLKSVIQECEIIKHLFTKIPQEKLDYSPHEDMRTTLELLQYLSFAPYEFAVAVINDAFKTSNWKSYVEAEKQAQNMKATEFPEAMDKQIEKFTSLFSGLTDFDLINRDVTPGWSLNNKLGAALMDHSLKVVTAYRMQLFLYLKSLGVQLHSGNCWNGAD